MDILLLVWLSFGQAAIAWPDRDPVVLRVRAYADSQVDKGTVRGAEEVARRLLAAGGLKTEWRSCDTAESCPAVPGVRDAVVRLAVPAHPGRSQRCGQAALGDRPGAGTVTVSVPCVAAVASRLSNIGDVHGHPLLRMARYDDILGAAVAHELGHVLGLKHGEGLMLPLLGPDQIVQLRKGSLGFSHLDAARVNAKATMAARRQ